MDLEKEKMKNQTIKPIDCHIIKCSEMMISGIDHHTNGATVNVNLYNGKLNYNGSFLQIIFVNNFSVSSN